MEKHIKQRFNSNEDGWNFMYHYFLKYLHVLLFGYTTMGKQPCVIFDIDHTVLYYWTPLIASMTPAHLMMPMQRRPQLRLTSPVALRLYNLFSQHKVPIYFVTARPGSASNRTATEAELKTLGFQNYKDIFFMPSVYENAGNYKLGVRNMLRAKHPILFNVGDQWTDFVNQHMIGDHVDNQAFLLFHVEPACDWGLKLITPKSHAFKKSSFSMLDSVFDTVAPADDVKSDVCHECGHLRMYH